MAASTQTVPGNVDRRTEFLDYRYRPNEVVEMHLCPICGLPRDEWEHTSTAGHLGQEDHTWERLVGDRRDIDTNPREGQTRLVHW